MLTVRGRRAATRALICTRHYNERAGNQRMRDVFTAGGKTRIWLPEPPPRLLRQMLKQALRPQRLCGEFPTQGNAVAPNCEHTRERAAHRHRLFVFSRPFRAIIKKIIVSIILSGF